METSISVGREYAARLPVHGYPLESVPLTRVRVVAQKGDQYVGEIAGYRALNLHRFHANNLARAISDGSITYVAEPRQIMLYQSDFVAPLGAAPRAVPSDGVWAARPFVVGRWVAR